MRDLMEKDSLPTGTSEINHNKKRNNGIFDRINQMKYKTVLVLSLGSTGIPPSSHPFFHHPNSELTKENGQEREGVYDGKPVYMGIQNLEIDGKTLTCQYEEQSVRAAIDDNGAVISMVINGVTVHMNKPIEQDALEPFLYRAQKSLEHIYKKHDTVQTITTNTGGQFAFEYEDNVYIVTPENILRLDEEYQEIEKELRIVTKNINNIENLQRTDLNARRSNIEVRQEKIITHMRGIRDKNYRYSRTWNEWNNKIWAFKNRWTNLVYRLKGKNGRATVSLNEYYTIQKDMENILEQWETFFKFSYDGESRTEFKKRINDIITKKGELSRTRKNLIEQSKKRVLHDDLDGRIITEQLYDDPRKFTREWTDKDNQRKVETYSNDQLVTRNSYVNNVRTAQEHFQYFNEGQVSQRRDWIFERGANILQKETNFWRNAIASKIYDPKEDIMMYFTLFGEHIVTENNHKNDSRRTVLMNAKDGSTFGNYNVEKRKNKNLTPDAYIKMLAKELDTPERLHFFFNCLVQYRYDHSDGRPGSDYWQTAKQTVQDISNGFIRGDCDDYAFLARDILRLQGKNSHVLLIPSHAICVWLEKKEDAIQSYSIGTYGLDQNGNHYGKQFRPSKTDGNASALDALNSLMLKYKYPDLGVQDGQDYTLTEGWIMIGDIPSEGSQNVIFVFSRHFLKDIKDTK